ncbi:MAG: helix-turn-helix domain-containing protein, partial [Pseudomonadota bacterium]
VITAELIDDELASASLSSATVVSKAGNAKERLQDAVAELTEELLAQDGGRREDIHHEILETVEHPMISVTLDRMRGNQIQAARRLGLNRNTLRKKVKNLGITILRAVGQPLL